MLGVTADGWLASLAPCHFPFSHKTVTPPFSTRSQPAGPYCFLARTEIGTDTHTHRGIYMDIHTCTLSQEQASMPFSFSLWFTLGGKLHSHTFIPLNNSWSLFFSQAKWVTLQDWIHTEMLKVTSLDLTKQPIWQRAAADVGHRLFCIIRIDFS